MTRPARAAAAWPEQAARGIEGFGARLRAQVDLDTLTADLLAVVGQTMQPTQASLWLRPPREPPRTPLVP